MKEEISTSDLIDGLSDVCKVLTKVFNHGSVEDTKSGPEINRKGLNSNYGDKDCLGRMLWITDVLV